MSVVRPNTKQRANGKKPKKDIISSTAGHLASKQKKHNPKISSQTAKLGKKSRPAKKQRVFTDEELGIPKLNMITPAGVQKPKGKKKGKIYVDDMESMMTIYAMVSAEKEGQIESKMMKARQLEEIREARAKEIEARQQTKRDRIDELKAAAKGKKNRKFASREKPSAVTERAENLPHKQKKVTFADSKPI